MHYCTHIPYLDTRVRWRYAAGCCLFSALAGVSHCLPIKAWASLTSQVTTSWGRATGPMHWNSPVSPQDLCSPRPPSSGRASSPGRASRSTSTPRLGLDGVEPEVLLINVGSGGGGHAVSYGCVGPPPPCPVENSPQWPNVATRG